MNKTESVCDGLANVSFDELMKNLTNGWINCSFGPDLVNWDKPQLTVWLPVSRNIWWKQLDHKQLLITAERKTSLSLQRLVAVRPQTEFKKVLTGCRPAGAPETHHHHHHHHQHETEVREAERNPKFSAFKNYLKKTLLVQIIMFSQILLSSLRHTLPCFYFERTGNTLLFLLLPAHSSVLMLIWILYVCHIYIYTYTRIHNIYICLTVKL